MVMAPSSLINGVGVSSAVQITESSYISPPPATTTPHSYSLPLTFFDIPSLQYPPLQPLFFFQLAPVPVSFLEFSSNILPRLKHSLSSALQYFFPFAGKLTTTRSLLDNLSFLTENGKSDSVGLTVALCDADFNDLSSYAYKSAHIFQQLVPSLPTIASSTIIASPIPLLAIQITFFPSPSSGFSIGFASHPVLCDQRTFSNFLYTWASFSKSGHLNFSLAPTYPASFDRSVILDSNGLQSIMLEQWLGLESHPTVSMKMLPPPPAAHASLQSTFVMGSADIANAKRWLQAQCDKLNRSYPVLLSPYVVTCAFVWTCFLRAQVQNSFVTKAKAKGPMYFGFIAGGITRLPYQVSAKYFGNCVGFGRAVAMREELLKEGEGMLAAADAIGKTVKMLDSDVLGGAERWISEWQTLIKSEDHIHVVGSPKVNLYETDFGWGKPKKIEEISIDGTRAISLTQSRHMKSGIEIGLTLSNFIMDDFQSIFTQGLRVFAQ
ncbi:coumaroyl-CoA:anthocyanidin 3-O-glucoside-6''-O-coumaroyltransferase 2-like [Chenopodium quinoa]|nr:coumaroyl-CoA:anthocyanidin 3-O-glucoside-6''-O-coumaroyltransferase 2-like [Chenopodium quinoa]